MLKKINSSDCIETRNFGDFCPYWTLIDGQVVVADTAEEIFSAVPFEKRRVDPVAFFELLEFNYILGNRTILQGVSRMPWRSTLRGDGTLERRPPIEHGTRQVAAPESAQTLRELLEEELHIAAQQAGRIFLLLTGGLDSRVIAGVLKKIEPGIAAEIKCVTWGIPESRDVAYARRIAAWYDWEFIHVPYDSELVWSNMFRAAVWGGSEVAGLHLHAMDWFRNARPDDLVIAASFGDSIGRAEYSSHHLLACTLTPIKNSRLLIHPTLAPDMLAAAERDRATAWEMEKAPDSWIRVEHDMQENYMRRMICHAMDYIRQFCRVHQAFTSDRLVSYMWSLSPETRTDEIYCQLFRQVDGRLYSLPWARSGIAPDGTPDKNQSLKKNYHECSEWLRKNLRERIEPLFFSPGLCELNIFHTQELKRLWNAFLISSNGHFENVMKLCSLELTRRHFNILPSESPLYFRDICKEELRRRIQNFCNCKLKSTCL